MNWPWTKTKPTLEVRQVGSTSLRLSEWQGDSKLVSLGASLWSNSDFRISMDVMENEHPAFNVLPLDAPPHVRIAYQARCEGYTMALANLKALGEFRSPAAENLTPTFEPEEKFNEPSTPE